MTIVSALTFNLILLFLIPTLFKFRQSIDISSNHTVKQYRPEEKKNRKLPKLKLDFIFSWSVDHKKL